MLSKNKLKVTGAYLAATILCMLILAWVLKLWHADFNIPFAYNGDSLYTGMMIKGLINNGWYLHNSFVGMPTGSNLYDFPMTDNLSFLVLKILSLITSNYGLILNLFFLLTFPLTTLTSLYALRHFKVSNANAITASILFTFLPYHFFRGESHLFLAAYFVVPLITMVILWVYSDDYFLICFENNRIKKFVFNYKSVISIIICLLVASSGVYYAFFSCFFLLVAGITTGVHRKNLYHLIVSLSLIVVVSFGVLINISPTIIYRLEQGVNNEVARRSPGEAEAYGLKIDQLLLPVSGHRLAYIANKKEAYNSMAPLVNENDFSSLGVIGGLGFLFSIGWILLGKSYNANNLYTSLSELNVSALLLGTVGGFGSLFAILISPEIRAYNRISIFIGFFSLLVLFLLFDYLSQRLFNKSKLSKMSYYAIVILLLIFGVADQTNNSFVPAYAAIKTEYNNDADFVKTIETTVPKGSMVFQLPYFPFPENPPLYNLPDYDLFKGYLHSDTLKWSYGAVKGREGDFWQQAVSSKPVDQMVQTLAFAGFNGIYLDRNGFADNGKDIEAKIIGVLKVKPLVSSNNRLVFFNMVDYNKGLKQKYSPETWELKRDSAIHPILTAWRGGFSSLEGAPSNNWRWSSSEGELWLYNLSKKPQKVTIQMSLATGYEDFSNLTMECPAFSEKLKVNVKDQFFIKTLVVPPGSFIIKFKSDAKRIINGDPRTLVFKVVNFGFKATQ